MKKQFLPILMLFIFAFTTFTFVSCNKEVTKVKSNETLDTKLSKDALFKNTLDAAAQLGMTLNVDALSDNKNIAELETLAAKINNKTASTADYARVQVIVGVSYDELIASLQKFGLTLNELNKKYPELAKMDQTEMASTFTKAIQSNSDLQNFVNNPTNQVLRVAACPLRDICNLAVVLTKLFAGDTICTAINVTTIPVVGGLLCQLVLNLGVGILTGICNALPC